MSFKYRLKTYNDEEGEYSDYLPATREVLLVLIAMYWTNETLPNGLEIISIANGDDQHLLLEHSNKHAFEVYYLPGRTRHHFHKKSNIDIVLDSLDLFFKGSITELEKSLNQTTKDRKYIRGDFFFIDHNYKHTARRSLKQALWMLWGWTPLLPPLLMFAREGFSSAQPLGFFIVFGIFTCILVLPGLYLHVSYMRDIADWTVRVTRGQDKIVVKSTWRSKEFSKADVVQVTQYMNSNHRFIWADYGYLEIEFKSGEIINLSNLLCDQLQVLDKFPGEVKKLTVSQWFPAIHRPTQIA